ncbi:MAG: peptidylprolyl isomerase, partial [Isosphaeraceae bacterium]|nr:peptidylprolyl isomerase [Isosphaeraceae bacterium]
MLHLLCLAGLGAIGLLALAFSVGSASAADEKDNPVVVIDTNMGQITAELYADKAPITVKNFLRYVDEGFYNGTVFHRVIPGFMIQGGGHEKDTLKEKKTHETIKNESNNGLKNQRGTLAMARKPDPDSASAQFFINLKDNPFLDRE